VSRRRFGGHNRGNILLPVGSGEGVLEADLGKVAVARGAQFRSVILRLILILSPTGCRPYGESSSAGTNPRRLRVPDSSGEGMPDASVQYRSPSVCSAAGSWVINKFIINIILFSKYFARSYMILMFMSFKYAKPFIFNVVHARAPAGEPVALSLSPMLGQFGNSSAVKKSIHS
jgi:hypothetical protein